MFEFPSMVLDAISAAALIITAYFILRQTKATKDLVKNETRPILEVGLMRLKDGNETKTYLQYINVKGIPAWIWINTKIFINGKDVANLKIDGELREVKEFLGTQLSGDGKLRIPSVRARLSYQPKLDAIIRNYEKENIMVSFGIFIAPIFLEGNKERFDKRDYKFVAATQNWEDTQWGADKPDSSLDHLMKRPASKLGQLYELRAGTRKRQA
jgi:hypothetical protein